MHSFKKKLLTSVSALFLATVTFSGAAEASARLSLGGVDETTLEGIYSTNIKRQTSSLKISTEGANAFALKRFFQKFDTNFGNEDESIATFNASGSLGKINKIDRFDPAFTALIKCFADMLVNRIFNVYEDKPQKRDAFLDHLKSVTFIDESVARSTVTDGLSSDIEKGNNPIYAKLFVEIDSDKYSPFYKTLAIKMLTAIGGSKEDKAEAIYDYLADAANTFTVAAHNSIQARLERDALLEDHSKLEEELNRLQGLYHSKEDAVDKLGRDLYAARLRAKELEESVRALENASASTAHDLVEVQEEKTNSEAEIAGKYKNFIRLQIRLLDAALKKIPGSEAATRAALEKSKVTYREILEQMEQQGMAIADSLNLFVNDEFEEIKARLTQSLQEANELALVLRSNLERSEEEKRDLSEQLRKKDKEMRELHEENERIQEELEKSERKNTQTAHELRDAKEEARLANETVILRDTSNTKLTRKLQKKAVAKQVLQQTIDDQQRELDLRRDRIRDQGLLLTAEEDKVKDRDLLLQQQGVLMLAEQDKVRDRDRELVAEQDKVADRDRELVAEQDKVRDRDRELVAEQDKVRDREQTIGDQQRELDLRRDRIRDQGLLLTAEQQKVADRDLQLQQQGVLMLAEQQKVRDREQTIDDQQVELDLRRDRIRDQGLLLTAEQDKVRDREQTIDDQQVELDLRRDTILERERELADEQQKVADRDLQLQQQGVHFHQQVVQLQQAAALELQLRQQILHLQQQMLVLQGQVPQARVFTAEELIANATWQGIYDSISDGETKTMDDGSVVFRDKFGGITRKLNKVHPNLMSWGSSFQMQGKTAPSIVLKDGTRL